MRTINKAFIKVIFIITAFAFVGWIKADKQLDNPKNVIILVKYKAQPTKETAAVSALTKLIENVKLEPHFVNIKLHIDPKDKTNILLYEEWDDEAYYNSKHMTTTHLQKFIGDSRNFLVGPPEITFWYVVNEYKK